MNFACIELAINHLLTESKVLESIEVGSDVQQLGDDEGANSDSHCAQYAHAMTCRMHHENWEARTNGDKYSFIAVFYRVVVGLPGAPGSGAPEPPTVITPSGRRELGDDCGC